MPLPHAGCRDHFAQSALSEAGFDLREEGQRWLSDHGGTHATTPYLRHAGIVVAGALLLSPPPDAAARIRCARSIDLRVHPALEPAGTDLPGHHHPFFLSIPVYLFANTKVYRKHYYRNSVLQRAFRFGCRPRVVSSPTLWSFSGIYFGERMVQTPYQREEGAGG